ncbi:MAG: TetR/AcrR family transcriptional regulator [Dehalococcoidia bacterium]
MPVDRVDRLPDARRRLLVRTAVREFATAGYEAASLNRIIRACGMSKSSFYHFIPSKQALFDLVVRDLGHALVAALRIPDPHGFAGDQFWPRVETLLDRLAELSAADDRFVQLGRMFYLSGAPTDESSAVSEALGSIESWLHAVLTVGRGSKAVRDDLPISLQSRLVFAVLRALDEWTLLHGDAYEPADLERLIRAEYDTLQRMLRPDPRP